MRDIPPRTAAVIIALALIASVVSGGERIASGVPALAEPAARAPSPPGSNPSESAPQVAKAEELDLDLLQHRARRGRATDLFAPERPAAPARRPTAAPASASIRVAAVQPQPAPRPVAPPLPFRYLGHLADGAKTSVFLERNQETLSVPVGETIAGTYRLEAITDQAIVFVYLPLGERQTLPIASRQP